MVVSSVEREGDCVCGGRRWHAAFHISEGLSEKVTLEQNPEASKGTMFISGGKASGRGNSQCQNPEVGMRLIF